jgi:hypothetical protein
MKTIIYLFPLLIPQIFSLNHISDFLVYNKSYNISLKYQSYPQNSNSVFFFDTLTYNFGTISLGDSVQHVFKGRNRGLQPIYIQRIQTTCPCETLIVSYEDNVILPGSQGSFKVRYKHYSQSRLFNEPINIVYRYGNNGRDEYVKLQINGFIN